MKLEIGDLVEYDPENKGELSYEDTFLGIITDIQVSSPRSRGLNNVPSYFLYQTYWFMLGYSTWHSSRCYKLLSGKGDKP